jgi:hypothetical protein
MMRPEVSTIDFLNEMGSMALPRVVNKLANDIITLSAAKGTRKDIATDVSAELATGIDQSIEERVRANSPAHELPGPAFDT